MQAIDRIGLKLNFNVILITLVIISFVFLAVIRTNSFSFFSVSPSTRTEGIKKFPSLQKFLFYTFLCFILVRLLGLVIEVTQRPLFPWDTWICWGVRGRIWFEHERIIDFVPNSIWWFEQPIDAYAVDCFYYPKTISLIQTWIALALNRWDDIFVNIPWFFCLVALALSFYGQIRLWASSPIDSYYIYIFSMFSAFPECSCCTRRLCRFMDGCCIWSQHNGTVTME